MTTSNLEMAGRNKLDDAELFDETVGYETEAGLRLAKGLTEDERKQAIELYKLFNELWGLCIVVGPPGVGKDTFSNILSHKIKRFFPYKRILRDEKPRKLFGAYAGLFNEQVLVNDLRLMRKIAKGEKEISDKKFSEALEKAAEEWVTNDGEVLLKNSVLYLTEFWRYCYNRESFKPMNKTMGAIHKMKRHLDCLVLGTVQLVSDLDKKTCLPWVDWQVTCGRSAHNPTGFTFLIQKVRYDRSRYALMPIGDPFIISWDAGKPRSYLGDGKIVIRTESYRPQTEEERIILDVIRAGVDNYEEMVELLATDGDMIEAEVLTTLKELKFRRNKRAIDFPCFFGLYNSKSAPQIRTSVRVED